MIWNTTAHRQQPEGRGFTKEDTSKKGFEILDKREYKKMDSDGEAYELKTLEKAAAAKFMTEQYYDNLFNSHEERHKRMNTLEVPFPPQIQIPNLG